MFLGGYNYTTILLFLLADLKQTCYWYIILGRQEGTNTANLRVIAKSFSPGIYIMLLGKVQLWLPPQKSMIAMWLQNICQCCYIYVFLILWYEIRFWLQSLLPLPQRLYICHSHYTLPTNINLYFSCNHEKMMTGCTLKRLCGIAYYFWVLQGLLGLTYTWATVSLSL